ncbi:Piso0_002330 [Millerozyma farinosa CBS 7064]|uniref:Piso0_002330 protein n=1 Tax=Pichia sorbitophila (strain ATCC MYA-4447 / BCRC 22081 / CBS 7064 / NBRC 10061 / NRRL Y-12695) TaxID=559304 RepID=G8YCB7_PICSO|nr:Piso0_002330 [Millerozyma farinosa CBS 7064]
MSVKSEKLVIPYRHIPAKPRFETSGVVAQSLPMAALFMKNRLLAWSALFLSIQSYLSEPVNKPVSKDAKDQSSQPASLRVVFALIALLTCYMDVAFPSTNPSIKSQSVIDAASTAASATGSASTK